MQKKVARGVPDEWVRKFLNDQVPGTEFRLRNVLDYIAEKGGPPIGETAIRNNLMVLTLFCEYLGNGLFRKKLPGG